MSTKKFNIGNNPWISVGGSYPGALSAWFKASYNSAVYGAWASSGVINAIEDFQDYDLDIYKSTLKSG